MNRPRIASLLATLTAAMLPWIPAGCGRRQDAGPGPASNRTAAAAAIPDSLFAPLPEEGTPLSIVEARKSVRDGERVLLRGRIGGRPDPFVAGRAIVLLVDESLPLCQGCCDTPWDMCCDGPEDLAAHSATVQVIGADGQPLRVSLRGQGGLQPLARIAVAGTLRREGEALFLVSAERLTVLAAE